jgi:hypothetical protein
MLGLGRDPDDLAVRTFAGALIGVVMAVMPAMVEDPGADFLALIDAALPQLEAGLPL